MSDYILVCWLYGMIAVLAVVLVPVMIYSDIKNNAGGGGY